MRRIIVVLALALVAAACAKPASPDPNQVSQLVQKAVEATLAAQPTQVAAPTATALPPTVAPTATREQPASATTVPAAVPAPTDTPPPTDTPEPTATPEPTPTETPAAPYVVASKAANLRSGPGTNYPVVGSAAAGKQYEITGRSPDGAWLEVCCVNGKPVWVARSVVAVSGDVDTVAVAQNIPLPPTPRPAPPPAPVAVRQSGPKWSLVADSAADFPGGSDHNNWFYLWTEGRNNFQWQDMQRSNETGCYRDSGGHNLEVCQYAIKADPSGDVGLQWKASRGGTYRIEWDSPWLKFYKHADFISTQGKGSELPFSAIIKDVIEWEMFFWVAGDSTPYHVRVYRLDEVSGPLQNASQPAPAPVSGGASELGVRKQSAGVALTVLNMQKTFQITKYWDAAPGDIALVIEVEIENTGRDQSPYNPFTSRTGQHGSRSITRSHWRLSLICRLAPCEGARRFAVTWRSSSRSLRLVFESCTNPSSFLADTRRSR